MPKAAYLDFLAGILLLVLAYSAEATLAFVSTNTNYQAPYATRTTGLTSSDVKQSSSDAKIDELQDALSNALCNTNYIMHPAFWQTETDAALQSFYQSLLDSVKTKTSTIPGAGLGLFAARDIEAGSIVSFYPVHTMGCNLFRGGSEWVALDDTDQEYSMSTVEHNGPNYALYLLGNRPPEAEYDGTMIVDCNPNRPDIPGWIAHRINDGAIIEENTERGILSYLEKSMQKQNVVISPWGPSPLLAAFTTKDICKGEELFTSYGVSYWLDATFSEQEWQKKTDAIKEKEKLLFECYLYYAKSGSYQREADALQAVFDSL